MSLSPSALEAVDHDELYAWIDEVPLSRPKKNIQRDFSDGVATAEVISHFIPKMVDLHNYPPANGTAQKVYNWKTLDQKVLRKLNYHMSDEVMDGIVNKKSGYVEYFLNELRTKIDAYIARRNQPRDSGQLLPLNAGQWNMGSGHVLYPYGAPLSPEQYGQMYSSGMLHGSNASIASQSAMPYIASAHGDNQLHVQLPPTPVAQLTAELQETVEILQVKTQKLEELLALKDRKIEELDLRLRSHGLL
ncbi:hypothetical protein DFJ77DRAFT_451058 [Powellomyces hirtus]|nr:hypothetical protein DFJ77DRAFT_451058 [Powellomyces hirtus]